MRVSATAGWTLACLVSIAGVKCVGAQEQQPISESNALLSQPAETVENVQPPARVGLGLQFGATPDTVVLNLNRLYSASDFGRRVLQEREEAFLRLIRENEVYVKALEQEERWLDNLRTMGVVSELEFGILAEVFDDKVNSRRERQDRIVALLSEWNNQNQGEFTVFIERSLPELARQERFQIVLNASETLYFPPSLDITGLLLEEVNRNLGDGTRSLNYETPEQYVSRNAPAI